MEAKLLFLTAFIVNFTIIEVVKAHDIIEDQVSEITELVTFGENSRSNARENFQNLFESLAKDDLKRGNTYREILNKDTARERKVFGKMEEELWAAKKKNIEKKENVYRKTNVNIVDTNRVLIKRETNSSHKGQKMETEVKTDELHKRSRLLYCASLVDDHINFMERIIANSGIRKDDLKTYWMDEDPARERKNLQALTRFDNNVKGRILVFLKRSKGVVEKCFNTTSFNDEVRADVAKEINDEQKKIAEDAKKFFLQELPNHLYKLITDWEALNTTGLTKPTERSNRRSSRTWRVDTS